MLQAIALCKNYGELPVVRDVSLTVDKGEIIAITGPSGAGKSTLLHLLGALDRPDKGRVIIGETDVFKLPSRKQAAFRNKHLGFVFQFHHLLPEFSAVENVAMPLWIRGVGHKKGLVQAEEMLGIVGLSGRARHKPSEMSGGEQQRVAVARALVHRPEVVMLDEPTGNLDSGNARATHDLFIQLCRQYRQTFIIVTHNEELAAMTDRVIGMRDGRLAEISREHAE